MKLTKEKVLPIIINALKEDIGSGDITGLLLFDRDFNIEADIIINEQGIVAGIDIARWIFNTMDEKISFTALCKDGDKIKKTRKIIHIKGSVKNVLAAERTVLNFLSQLSGIATLTNKFVDIVRGTDAKIFDTRKTTPGLRDLEKYAVRVGGGCNHRMGLWDGILIKDNHLIGVKRKAQSAKPKIIKDAISAFKEKGYKNIEIEVNDLKEFKEALQVRPDIIMLDNMKIDDIRKAVGLRSSACGVAHFSARSEVLLEVSGGVTLENVRSIAKSGVDRISIGSLTHSASSIDFSLEIL